MSNFSKSSTPLHLPRLLASDQHYRLNETGEPCSSPVSFLL
jgi:hypothetical protein